MTTAPGSLVGATVSRATAALAVLLLAVPLAGCSDSGTADPPPATSRPGCGLVKQSRVVGLVGRRVQVSAHGSLADLRRHHRRLACATLAAGHDGRSVRVVASYHPKPYTLPRRSCAAGWVIAGSVQKNAPACQQDVGHGGRTRLIVRWQPYLMTVTVERPDRNWGGDPEIALAMSRDLARHLGVREAAGDG